MCRGKNLTLPPVTNIYIIMRLFNTLLFVMFALSANAADGTVGTVSVQKGNNVSVNGEAPLSTNRKYSSDKRV